MFCNREGANTIVFDRDVEPADIIDIKTLTRRENYLKNMKKNSSTSEINIRVNDYVLIKKDYDNNTKTKKNMLVSLLGSPRIVVEILNENKGLVLCN